VSTLDNLRKSAKRWLKALRAGDADARARLGAAWPEAPASPSLRDVQHALARERGHDNWVSLTRAAASTEGHSPLEQLFHAAGNGDVAAATAILDAYPGLINERGAIGESGLRTALHFGSGHEPIVRLLLDRGADPNIRDEGDNAYPLHFAAERGDLRVVQLLVEHGADPAGAGTTHELDVLGWAVCFEYAFHPDVARYLLAHGARHTVLTAVAMGEVDALRALSAAGANLDARMDGTNQRRTPLHLALVKRQPAALVALLELGANPNLEDAAGLTPLDYAALAGDTASATTLLNAGARVTVASAIVLGRSEDLGRLIREDPDVVSMTSRERWGRLVVQASTRASGPALDALLTALTRYRGGLSVVNVDAGPDTAVDGAGGYSPLHAAAFHGNHEAVEVLLRHGADVRRRDTKYCATPAGWADYAGHPAVRDRILASDDVDLFDAVAFDRADLAAAVLERDPDALHRPFKAYASCAPHEGRWWPSPDQTPLDWARAQKKTSVLELLEQRADALAPDDVSDRADRVAAFLQVACWDHHVHGKAVHRMHARSAERLLARDPWIAREQLVTAIVCGELDEVRRVVAAAPESARTAGGSRNWTPILYLAYTRFPHRSTVANAIEIARVLLDAGANPNDFYMAMDARYTVLTGVAGEGEQDAPRQPYAAGLFDLLLEHGAAPFDIQVLYNTHFSGDMMWWLDLVHRHTADTPRGEAWKNPDWPMLDMGAYGCGARFILETAIKRRRPELARWALERGAHPNPPPARDHRFPKQSLYEYAVMEGQEEIATLLLDHGAPATSPTLDDRQRLVAACLAGERAVIEALLQRAPREDVTHALFEAARRDRPDAVALLLDLGLSPDREDARGKRPLHEAAAANAAAVVELLLERGAEVDPRESTYHATPIGWAAYFDRREAMDVLARRSRDIWSLTFNGYVDRVREVLAEDPNLARATQPDGRTVLWWLPDDEDKALPLVELLLGAGADPHVIVDGRTAADAARRRGMFDVAQKLGSKAPGTRH
jgi:ankyrin repeat protein